MRDEVEVTRWTGFKCMPDEPVDNDNYLYKEEWGPGVETAAEDIPQHIYLALIGCLWKEVL